VTQKRTKPLSIEQLWAYEAKHPVIFAAPRALAEARLIVDLGRAKRNRRRHVIGAARRKLATA